MALFDALFELKWRGIAVPCESLEAEGSQDLAEHKRVDRDGARLEGMGLNPYVFPVRIPFINNLLPGVRESWDPLKLFPDVFLQFLAACEDRSTGPLQHPIHGDLQCKAASWKYSLSGDTRGGVVMDVTFKVTTEDEAVLLGETSALGMVLVTSTDLTDQLGQLNPAPDLGLTNDGFADLEDFANQLASVGDQAELLQNKVVGKIDTVIAKVNKVADGIDKTANVITTAPGDTATHTMQLGPAAARIVESCERLTFALTSLKTSLGAKDKTIGFVTTAADSTLGGLAVTLLNAVEDLIALNPLLVAQPVIPPQTVVRYYKAA